MGDNANAVGMRSIIKADKKTLATLDGDQLAKKIDGFVRSAFRRSEDASAELRRAQKEREEYTGEDKAEIARLNAQVEDRRVQCKRRIEDIEYYLAEQMELFASRGLDKNRAYKEAIVPTGEILPNGREMLRIVKRGETLEQTETDDETRPSVSASRSYSERMGMGGERRRGKFNDADRLIEQAACSIDRSEVMPMFSACM